MPRMRIRVAMVVPGIGDHSTSIVSPSTTLVTVTGVWAWIGNEINSRKRYLEMIYEPQVECICDSCGTDETVTPEYKFKDFSGNSGYYACEDDDIIDQLPGWVITHEGKILCDECA